MNEVTPELIAQIASRLISELPGASLIPKADSEPVPSMSAAENWPGRLPEFASGQQVPPNVVEETASAPSFAPPVAAADSSAGLRSFVQSIRATRFRSGECVLANDPSQEKLRRLFAGKTVPAEGPRPLDVPSIRQEFPALSQQVHGKPLAWLDNAATTQKPQSVIDALSRFYAHDNSNIHRGAHTLAARATDAFEQARQKVQTFLGASSTKEIIFVRGTTEGINLVAQTYGRKFLQPGDEIVLSTLEHHANIVPWQLLAQERGAILRVIPVTDRGEIMLEEYQRLLGTRTRLVALTHASNSLGTILPVAEMTQMAKRFGARVLIDGANPSLTCPSISSNSGATSSCSLDTRSSDQRASASCTPRKNSWKSCHPGRAAAT